LASSIKAPVWRVETIQKGSGVTQGNGLAWKHAHGHAVEAEDKVRGR